MDRTQYPPGSEAEKYALRWVTIGRKQTGDGKTGGFPVQIDDDGKIVGGKRAESLGLHNVHVGDVKEHFDERRAIQSQDDGGDFSFDFGEESTASKRKAASKELPAKRTQLRELLIDAAGEDERDQASLYDRMKQIVAREADYARDFNDQLDEFYGSKTTERKLSLIGKLRKRSDPSKVEGFDELLQEARSRYPALLNHPEAGGDEEWSLAEAIRSGKRRVPTIMDDDVLEEAMHGWEPPSQYVSEYDPEMEAIPFARGSEAEKYHRLWSMRPVHYAKDGERWITIGGQKADDGKRKGGRPVLIDKDGVIVGGAVPKQTHGKPVGEFGKHVKGAEKSEEKPVEFRGKVKLLDDAESPPPAPSEAKKPTAPGLDFPADDKRPTPRNREAASEVFNAAYQKHRRVFEAIAKDGGLMFKHGEFNGGDVQAHYNARIQNMKIVGDRPTPTNAALHKAVARGVSEMEDKTRRLIEYAQKENLPVPPEVLKDYPELAKTAKPAEQPAVTKPKASPKFDPSKAVKVAADDVSKLRQADVFRVLEWTPAKHRQVVADHIAGSRPDLKAELGEVAEELGMKKTNYARGSLAERYARLWSV